MNRISRLNLYEESGHIPLFNVKAINIEYIMKRTPLIIILLYLILYLLQFLIIPCLYTNVIGRGNEGAVVIFITTTLTTVAGMIVYSDKFRLWLQGIVLYTLLMILYTPEGAYGIGIVGIDLDGLQAYYDESARLFGVFVTVISVILLQFAIWCIIKLSKTIIKKIKNR